MKLSLWCCALTMSTVLPCLGHIGYTGRDFGTLLSGAPAISIANQAVSGNFGWADGTDDNHGDSHKLRYYRFNLQRPAWVNIRVEASTNGGSKDGNLKPAFSLYRGLAHLPPISTAAGGSADHDGSAISQAWRNSLGYPTEGSFHALKTWRIGGDNQAEPEFNFDAPDGLSTFTYITHRADGNADLFGNAPGIDGDGKADGLVTHWVQLKAGDYTLAVGGASYAGGETDPVDAGSYGVLASLRAAGFDDLPSDPAPGGITYAHRLLLPAGGGGNFSDHVGAWSWEDNALFGNAGQGNEPVGWTHTSQWVALRVLTDQFVTIRMERDAEVPWPDAQNPDRLADTESMFPSFTLWHDWDNDGEDSHTYNNRGNVAWAEDLDYLDHVNNSSQPSISRRLFLAAGDYTLALGSNAPASNTNRQGFRFSVESSIQEDSDPQEGGIVYDHFLNIGRGGSGTLLESVRPQSWRDPALALGVASPLGNTAQCRWIALVVRDPIMLNLRLSAQPGDNLNPSFTLWREWESWGNSGASFSNSADIIWAPRLTYMDHADNPDSITLSRSYTLPPGRYTMAFGSQSNSADETGKALRLDWTTSTPALIAPQILAQPTSAEVIAGRAISLSVRASGPELAYQWFHLDRPIIAATSAQLTLDPVSINDAGTYHCVVRNSVGWLRSRSVTLRVIAPPVVAPFNIPNLKIGEYVEVLLQSTPAAGSYKASGLPKGLLLESATGRISGRPLEVRNEVRVEVIASNAAGNSAAVSDSFRIDPLPAGLASSYVAAVPRLPTLNQMLGGLLRIEINTLGNLSGSLTNGMASPLRFVGSLQTGLNQPSTSLLLLRPNQPHLTLQLVVDPLAQTMQCYLADPFHSIGFTASAAATSTEAQPLLGGHHSAWSLSIGDQGDDKLPQGHSVCALKVSASGQVSAVCLLADGNKLTLGTSLRKGGNLPLFLPLYRGAGSCLGHLSLGADGNGLDNSNLDWFKAAKAGDLAYADGFGPLALDVVGGPYQAPALTALPMGLMPGTPNASLEFEGGGLSLAVQNPDAQIAVSLQKSQAIGNNPTALVLSIDKGRPGTFTAGSSGSFRGSFKLTDSDRSTIPARPLSRSVNFQGLLVPVQGQLIGYGFFILPQMPSTQPRTTLSNSPRLSGSVLLRPGPI